MTEERGRRPRGMPLRPHPTSVTPCFTWSAWFSVFPNGELPANTRPVTLPPVRFSRSFTQGSSTSTTKPCVGGTKVVTLSSTLSWANERADHPSARKAASDGRVRFRLLFFLFFVLASD